MTEEWTISNKLARVGRERAEIHGNQIPSPHAIDPEGLDCRVTTEGLDDDILLQGMWIGPDAINGRLGSLTNP